MEISRLRFPFRARRYALQWPTINWKIRSVLVRVVSNLAYLRQESEQRDSGLKAKTAAKGTGY